MLQLGTLRFARSWAWHNVLLLFLFDPLPIFTPHHAVLQDTSVDKQLNRRSAAAQLKETKGTKLT